MMRGSSWASVATLAAAAVCGYAWAAPWAPPHYRQCDPRWGSNEMGVQGPGERSTICGEGCAMTSVTMALAGWGITVNGSVVNPGSMNAWLEANAGYVCMDGDCNNLVLDAPDKVPGSPLRLVGETAPPAYETAMQQLQAGSMVYLLHVRNATHFVLALGPAPGQRGARGVRGAAAPAQMVAVLDPFYNSSSYDWSTVSDVIAYQVAGADAPRAAGGGQKVLRLHRRQRGAAPAVGTVPNPMPLFMQCDPRWGNDLMETQTICAVGCLMSSVSMALNGRRIPAASFGAADPGTLNQWLRANGGYTDGNDLIESSVQAIARPGVVTWNDTWSMHTTNDLSIAQVQAYVRNETFAIIANVMQGQHFVLVVGWEDSDPDELYINDPGFNRTTYSYSHDVVGWRIFGMIPQQ